MPSEENKSKEQKAAESDVESFRKDLGPFVVAAETTRMAMVFTDAKESNHPLIFSNDSFLALAGYSRKKVLGQSFDFLLGRPAEPAALAQIEAAFAVSAESDFEVCSRRKDGSAFWAAVFISPIRDKSGDIVQYFASFVDVTKHMQEEEHLRFLLAALSMIGAEAIDVAVLDVNLNGEMSYPIADALGARGVPFVFVTGYAEDRLLDGYRSFPVLQKPFHRVELTDTLAKLLTPRESNVESLTGTVAKTSP